MQNNKLLSISKIILALCIMLSLIWLGDSMQKLTNIQTQKTKWDGNVLTLWSIFPYFIVNDKMYFYKQQIDEWLKEVLTQRKEYDTISGFVF